MSAGFFTGITEGFFNARRESEMQTREQDEKRRQETIGVLSNLMEQADPRSRNILLGQIGEVMGLRGKQRNFWDTLTGKAQFDLQDQLQQKLKDVLGMVKGPEEYEQMQQMATTGPKMTAAMLNPNPNLVGLFSEGPARVQQAQQAQQAREQLPRTIGLRDQRAEKMQEFEFQRRLIQEQQTARDRERAEAKKEELQYRAQMKQQQEEQELTTSVFNRARLVAFKRLRSENPTLPLLPNQIDGSFISDSDWQEATKQIMDTVNLDAETKTARLAVLNAQKEALTGGSVAIDPKTLQITAPPGGVRSKADVAATATVEKLKQGRQRIALEYNKMIKQGDQAKAARLQTMGGAYAQARVAYEQAAAPLVKGLAQYAPELQAEMTTEGIFITRQGKKVPLTEADLNRAAQTILLQQIREYKRVLPQLAGARQNMKDNFSEQLKQLEKD